MTVPSSKFLVSHSPCRFPFSYGTQKDIYGCLSSDDGSFYWCATDTNEQNEMPFSSDWGVCPQICTGENISDNNLINREWQFQFISNRGQ